MYGESDDVWTWIQETEGLSPRVRGIHPHRPGDRCVHGSIPACTGNPIGRGRRRQRRGVYPRVYGESVPIATRRVSGCGLSPRVRGIRRRRYPCRRSSGSIPACTGNPSVTVVVNGDFGVYPRVYGESRSVRMRKRCRRGLSPRVRGIPADRAAGFPRVGSIPACTGNPPIGDENLVPEGVYPRVYGESLMPAIRSGGTRGLSPRVRGIRRRGGRIKRKGRSIPACTGNPSWNRPRWASITVYPRVYGESTAWPDHPCTDYGLSPRVRGIPRAFHEPRRHPRSIPACTGNPTLYLVIG